MHKFSFWDYDMAGRSRNRLAFFIALILLSGIGCQGPVSQLPPTQPDRVSYRSFYHWQTTFALSREEQNWLDNLEINRLYLKFFDLDWDPVSSSVIPLASLELDTAGLADLIIVPTIFITNRSILQIRDVNIPKLAQRMVTKVDRLYSPLQQNLQEVQLDCDWTGRSRAKYFQLLENLQSIYSDRGISLSVTIRLHQLRYPEQTGLPPVKKGVLMFYNMGDLQDWQESNSILNLEKAAAYLPNGLDYPLQLDLALPLFRWAVLFRDGQMIKLINEPNEAILGQSEKFQQYTHNRFEVIQSTYLDGYYLYKGDKLRVETVSVPQLKNALTLLRKQYPAAAHNLIWYHLDTSVIKRYDWETIAEMFGE